MRASKRVGGWAGERAELYACMRIGVQVGSVCMCVRASYMRVFIRAMTSNVQ